MSPRVQGPTRETRLLLSILKPAPGIRFLEVGVGTGVLSVHLAKYGADVLALDCSPYAVRLARRNAAENKVPLQVIRTNMFAGIRGRFDVVVYNPTHLPRNFLGRADAVPYCPGISKEDSIRVFFEGLHRHLAPHGKAYFVMSTSMPLEWIYDLLSRSPLHARTIVRKNYGNEAVSILELTASGEVAAMGIVQALEWEQQGEYRKAAEALRPLLPHGDAIDRIGILRFLARCYERLGEPSKAARRWRDSAELFLRVPATQMPRDEVIYEALLDLRDALEEAWHSKTLLRSLTRRYTRVLEECLSRFGDEGFTHKLIIAGLAWGHLGDAARAVRYLRRAGDAFRAETARGKRESRRFARECYLRAAAYATKSGRIGTARALERMAQSGSPSRMGTK